MKADWYQFFHGLNLDFMVLQPNARRLSNFGKDENLLEKGEDHNFPLKLRKWSNVVET